jgi:hypothetical protein
VNFRCYNGPNAAGSPAGVIPDFLDHTANAIPNDAVRGNVAAACDPGPAAVGQGANSNTYVGGTPVPTPPSPPVVCAQFQGTFAPGYSLGEISAAKDASIGRLVVGGNNVDGVLYNTNGYTAIATLNFSANNRASYVPPSQKFCFNFDDNNNGFVLVSATTGTRQSTIGTSINNLIETSWSAVDNGTYGVGSDFGSPQTFYMTRLDATSETIVLNQALGNPPSGGDYGDTCLFVPTPKSLIFNGWTNTASLDQFAVPSGAFLGTLNLNPNTFNAFPFRGGLIYAPNTGHVYCSTTSNGNGGTYWILEIDPVSFTVVYTYLTGVNASTTFLRLAYNPVTGAIYGQLPAALITINPITRTIVCSSTISSGFSLDLDQFSDKVFVGTGSTISVYE